MELLISIVIGILIVEAYAWLPQLSHWLIDRAVQRLRTEDQDRCREEWTAGLNALPNTLVKLIHALSCVSATHRINTDFFEFKLTEIDALIKELDHEHSRMATSICAAKQQLGRSQNKLVQHLDQFRAFLKTQRMNPPNRQLKISWVDLMRPMEEFADTYGSAAVRSNELLAVHVDRYAERLNHVQSLIHKVSQKRAQVIELLGRRGVSPDRLDALLADLANDLITVKGIFEDDKWGDDDAFREHKRIASVIAGVMQSISARHA